jgi:ABC-2 type transport system ATP-binding protein/lipopolysaccharide transport system ATP-binding protein
MTSLILNHVSVEFPIYNARGRSFRGELLRRTVGGGIQADQGGHVSVWALRDINLTLRRGDRLGLIGGNGAGKSTLLRILSGVYEPPVGRVTIEGKISSLTDIMMGMDHEATGYENIFLRGVFLGLSSKEIQAGIKEIEEFTELGHFLNLPMRTYSSGMMLRLAFAVTTAMTPEILIMDEMIGAGDAAFLAKAQARLERMIGGAHIMVLASHSEAILRRFCDKVALMREGRIIRIGPTDEVLRAYMAA